MKRVNLKGILAISFLLIFFIATSSYSQAWRGQGRVRGEVLSKDGKPIPNAKIIFTSAKLATKFEVKTDKDGKWKVNGVAGGVWDIDIIAPGYEPKRLTTKISEYLRNKPIIVYLKRAKKPVADEETVKKIDEANQLMSEKKYKEAITIFEQILKENPQKKPLKIILFTHPAGVAEWLRGGQLLKPAMQIRYTWVRFPAPAPIMFFGVT